MTVHYLPLLAPADYHILDEAGRAADIAAVLDAARTLHVDEVELTEYDRWNITRILGRDAAQILNDIGAELAEVYRLECESAAGTWDGNHDPDRLAGAFRSSAQAIAERAVKG